MNRGDQVVVIPVPLDGFGEPGPHSADARLANRRGLFVREKNKATDSAPAILLVDFGDVFGPQAVWAYNVREAEGESDDH